MELWHACEEKPSDFGAFVDSVTDRYSELIIFGGFVDLFS